MKKQIVILLILSLIFTLCFGVSIAEAKTYSKSTESKISKTVPQIKSVTSTVNGMKISYKKVDKAEGYIIYKVTKSNGKNKYTKLGTTKNLYYYDTKAEYGKTYKYSVSAYYGDVKSKKSAVKSKKCTMVKGPELSGTFVFEDCIAHLKWTTVTKAEKYNIYRSTSKNSGYKKVATTKNTYYDDEIRDLGFKYYYKVKPIIDNKDARYSNKFCADAVLECPEIIEDECYEDGYGNVIITTKPQSQVIGSYVVRMEEDQIGVNDVQYNNGIIKFKKPAFQCSEYRVYNLYNIHGSEQMGFGMFSTVNIVEKPMPKLQILKAGINQAAYKLDVAWTPINIASYYYIHLMKDGRTIYNELVEGEHYGQIDFTNRVEGAYSIYIEAYSSGDSIKSETYTFFWKRPQEYYPNYGYDDYTPPIVIQPDIQDKNEITIPQSPRCSLIGCEETVNAGGEYCINHGCMSNGCKYLRDGGGFYCRVHTCDDIGGCINGTENGTNYCTVHLCREEGCNDSYRSGRNYYCATHMRCVIDGCTGYRDPGSKLCRFHLF